MAYRVIPDRPDGPPEEANDCTVVALARAAGVPYASAHAALAAAGRQVGQGATSGVTDAAALSLGYRVEPLQALVYGGPGIHLGPFARAHATGSYLVETGRHPGRASTGEMNHIVAVVDGVVYDSNVTDWEAEWQAWRHAGHRVWRAWRVEPEP